MPSFLKKHKNQIDLQSKYLLLQFNKLLKFKEPELSPQMKSGLAWWNIAINDEMGYNPHTVDCRYVYGKNAFLLS